MDRHDLYEHCVQDPHGTVVLLQAMHGNDPLVLGEDFCGTAAVSHAWIDAGAEHRAIAIDHDADVVARIRPHDRLRTHCQDVLASRDGADVLFAGNFSIGELHTRQQLKAYFAAAHMRLRDGGIFVCDTYGGENAFSIGSFEQEVPLPGGTTVRYTWEQRRANPFTARVLNAMHFQVGDETFKDAFVYDWRLWSVPEIVEVLTVAGFAQTAIYARTPDAVDDTGRAHVVPLTGDGDIEESFDVLVCARN